MTSDLQYNKLWLKQVSVLDLRVLTQQSQGHIRLDTSTPTPFLAFSTLPCAITPRNVWGGGGVGPKIFFRVLLAVKVKTILNWEYHTLLYAKRRCCFGILSTLFMIKLWIKSYTTKITLKYWFYDFALYV